MQHKLAEFVVAIAGSSAYIHLWLVLRRVWVTFLVLQI